MFKKVTEILDRTFYPGVSRYWDDERFVKLIKDNLQPDYHILDFGAGRGKNEMLNFGDSVAHFSGADVDNGVLENPFLDEKKLIIPGQPLDFEDNQFDLIFSCNVLEHVGQPGPVFSEIRRILKPGGVFLSKTTNKNHYVATAARCTPLWFHKVYNQQRGREVVDTFPTTYQCNSRKQVERLAQETGLEISDVQFWEFRPEYLRINPLTYLAGIAYEKIVNCSPLLEKFRAVMVVELKKMSNSRQDASLPKPKKIHARHADTSQRGPKNAALPL